MPRTARAAVGGICYHVSNWGNGGMRVFENDADYDAFVDLFQAAYDRMPMRVVAFCVMPEHFHLVLWPYEDGDLGRWMQWLLTAHVRRHHRVRGSSGHVWQGRYKAFPISHDEYLLGVLRYVERNPVRRDLVPRAERWRWSSLRWLAAQLRPAWLHPGPVERPRDWLNEVNEPESEERLAALRASVLRGTPYGPLPWASRLASRLGLESTLRPRGRPRKDA